ncbi:hypothetical protein F4775DRAFT_565578 [Biscogniauxia sp. FL1348]|nr:hypothetical protein F4775DRAFT_565578 [Biscogniauxia sp. FL1348]
MAQEQSSSQSPNEAVARNSHEVSPIEPSSPRRSASSENTTTAPPLPARPANVANQQQQQQQQQQPTMPYAPYPYPPQQYQYTQPVRVLPKQSQRYIATKLGLTVLSSVLSIIIIALSSVLLSDSGAGDGAAYYAIPIAVAAIIWNTAELITYCVRLRRETQRGIHPGAHVALHLLFWLACVFAVLITVSLYISVAYTLARCTDSSDDDDSYEVVYGSSYRYRYCQQYAAINYYYWNYLPTLRALVAMFILTLINHFVLFVLACIDTHKRNLLKPAGVVLAPSAPSMYYAAPPPQPGMMPMPYYQYPVQPMAFPPQARLGVPPPAAPGQPMAQTPEARQALQNQQSLYGFYAPAPMPVPVPAPAPAPAPTSATAAAVHAPATLSPRQMEKAPASAQASGSAPAEASSSSNGKATPEQS